jgi:hypothetical protein
MGASRHDVEDDDVEAPAAREVEAAPPVGRFVHLEPREVEVEAKEVADGLFVFDDEDRSAPGAHAASLQEIRELIVRGNGSHATRTAGSGRSAAGRVYGSRYPRWPAPSSAMSLSSSSNSSTSPKSSGASSLL